MQENRNSMAVRTEVSTRGVRSSWAAQTVGRGRLLVAAVCWLDDGLGDVASHAALRSALGRLDTGGSSRAVLDDLAAAVHSELATHGSSVAWGVLASAVVGVDEVIVGYCGDMLIVYRDSLGSVHQNTPHIGRNMDPLTPEMHTHHASMLVRAMDSSGVRLDFCEWPRTGREGELQVLSSEAYGFEKASAEQMARWRPGLGPGLRFSLSWK